MKYFQGGSTGRREEVMVKNNVVNFQKEGSLGFDNQYLKYLYTLEVNILNFEPSAFVYVDSEIVELDKSEKKYPTAPFVIDVTQIIKSATFFAITRSIDFQRKSLSWSQIKATLSTHYDQIAARGVVKYFLLQKEDRSFSCVFVCPVVRKFLRVHLYSISYVTPLSVGSHFVYLVPKGQ